MRVAFFATDGAIASSEYELGEYFLSFFIESLSGGYCELDGERIYGAPDGALRRGKRPFYAWERSD